MYRLNTVYIMIPRYNPHFRLKLKLVYYFTAAHRSIHVRLPHRAIYGIQEKYHNFPSGLSGTRRWIFTAAASRHNTPDVCDNERETKHHGAVDTLSTADSNSLLRLRCITVTCPVSHKLIVTDALPISRLNGMLIIILSLSLSLSLSTC